MLKDRLIVCVANSWDYDPTSKHQIIRILSRHNDVIWVNYHGTRRPGVNRADLAAGVKTLWKVARGVRRVGPSFVQVTPLVIPGASRRWLQRLHQRMLVAQIRRVIESNRVARDRPVQVWSFAPDVPYLAGAFDEECFLYYCVDEYSQFEGFDPGRIVAAESELIDRADVVVTTSETLLKKKQERTRDAVLVRHGVEYDHFASAWKRKLKRPDDLAEVPGPIFGFFGLIHDWVDVALLAEVARLRPDFSFVLLGECKVDVSRLRLMNNVFLLGRRPYATLPAYCAAFDVGLLLFRRTAMTRNVNPIKMLEYLAAGLPVVSTSLPEARRYAGPITFGDSPDEFARACDAALACSRTGRGKAISQSVAGDTWESRVEELSEIILARVKRKNGVIPTGHATPALLQGGAEPQVSFVG